MARIAAGLMGRAGLAKAGRALEHDPEKWMPAFRKDHAPTKIWSATSISPNVIAL
jgi:hypothetical protein